MEKKRLCFECGSKDGYELKETIRHYEGDGYDFDLKVNLPFCKRCGAPIVIEEIEEEIAEEANRKIRECREIISKEEIIAILKEYSTSQKFLSRLLGWGEITLTRYVSGGYTPNKVNSDKLKSLKNPYVVQKLLDENEENTQGKEKEEAAFARLQKKVNERMEELETADGKIYQVTNWFLSQATEENPITHLALQKLLYFSQSWNKVLNGEWLFSNDCQAWVHGAVYPEIYIEFKKFKYLPLPKVEKKTSLREEECRVLEIVKKYYFDIYNAKALERICHLEEPYKQTRKGYREYENCEKVIDKQNMKDYYMKIAREYGITMEESMGIRTYLNTLLA